jgi:threonine 3-dehydrogenase
MKEGFDIGLEMSGQPARGGRHDRQHEPRRPDRHARPADKDPYPIDWGKVITHMLTIKGIYGREMYETWYKMSAMLQTSTALDASPRSSPTASHSPRLGSTASI